MVKKIFAILADVGVLLFIAFLFANIFDIRSPKEMPTFLTYGIIFLIFGGVLVGYQLLTKKLSTLLKYLGYNVLGLGIIFMLLLIIPDEFFETIGLWIFSPFVIGLIGILLIELWDRIFKVDEPIKVQELQESKTNEMGTASIAGRVVSGIVGLSIIVWTFYSIFVHQMRIVWDFSWPSWFFFLLGLLFGGSFLVLAFRKPKVVTNQLTEKETSKRSLASEIIVGTVIGLSLLMDVLFSVYSLTDDPKNYHDLPHVFYTIIFQIPIFVVLFALIIVLSHKLSSKFKKYGILIYFIALILAGIISYYSDYRTSSMY